MKNLIKDNIVAFICDKRKMIIFIIFAWFCGDELKLATSVNMSVFEYILLVMGNHYYIIYFLLIAYLFFIFDQMKIANDCVIIRMKLIKNKYLVQLFSVSMQTLILVSMHIAVAFIIGITRLEIINRFQTEVVEGYYNDTLGVVYGYQSYFSNPVFAAAAMGMYMTIGLTLAGMVVYVSNEIKGKKAALGTVGILLFGTMLGFKLHISGISEIFFANNYFILHHILFANGVKWILVNSAIILFLVFGMYKLVKYRTGNHVSKKNYASQMLVLAYTKSTVFLMAYILLNCISMYLRNKKFCLFDGIIINLIGFSADTLSFVELSKYVMFFAVPLFFIGEFLESEKRMCNDQVKIRYRNKSEWNKLVNYNINKCVYIYIVIFNSIMIILYMLNGFQIEGKKIIILSCLLKSLELIYYKNILRMSTKMLGNGISAYLLTFVGFLASILSQNPFISYGRSSLYYLHEQTERYGVLKLSIVLVGILLLKNVIIKIICWRLER